MKKRALSLVLALAMCLGLCATAIAGWARQVQAGDTSITDPNGVVYQLSNPIIEVKEGGEEGDNGWSTIYIVPEGTVITLLPPEGFTVTSEYGLLMFADANGYNIQFLGTTDPMGWGGLAEDETEFVMGDIRTGQRIFECIKRGNDTDSRGYIWFRTPEFDAIADRDTYGEDDEYDEYDEYDEDETDTEEPAAPSQIGDAVFTAAPTSATVLVNGENVSFDAYNIGGANFFKLRDIAFVLSGTEKQFEVSYDDATRNIALTSGAPYTPVGGELAAPAASGVQNAVPTPSAILLNGGEISLTAYHINGANYFKLRDLGETFDFGVDWDNGSKTISIDTSKGYTPD